MLIVEFTDNDNSAFAEVMRVLEKHSKFQKYEIQKKSKLSFSEFEIYHIQRKIYCNGQEIHLTAKEYDLLYLLAVNKGQVLTYSQIYERVWKNISSDDEKAVVGFHIHNLREKLCKASPKALFTIRCIREVGYCLEVNEE